MEIVKGSDRRIEEIIKKVADIPEEVENTVREILKNVREQGDEALLEYTFKYDNASLRQSDLKVSPEEIKNAYSHIKEGFISAAKRAKENIVSYHQRQLENSWMIPQKNGVIMGQIVRPMRRVGIYVPGGSGTTPLVSSLLMAALPAKVAGVKEIAVCTPPDRTGEANPHILVAADLIGLDEAYKVGGAQAIGALAYGTETIPRVDTIAGPGTIYTVAAKRQVYGTVGIDFLPGPSEVLIIADHTANPQFVVADMLAQAEHGESSMSIVITTSKKVAEAVRDSIEDKKERFERSALIEGSLEKHGAIVLVDSLDEAINIANRIAPEHIGLMVENPYSFLGRLENVGSVYIGPYSPQAVGDYASGSNHILPTGGTARFSSPLGVYNFLKRSSVVAYTKEGLAELKDTVVKLAEVEGLSAHAHSVRIRFDE